MGLYTLTRDQLLGDVINLITGTCFVTFGLVTFVIAIIRRRANGVRAIVLLGIWTIAYGSQRFSYNALLLPLLSPGMLVVVHYSRAAMNYLVLVVALLTFRELTLGFIRKSLTLLAGAAFVIFVLGFGKCVLTGQENWLVRYDQVLATLSLLMWVPFLAFPRFARKYTVLQDRGVLLAGYTIFGLQALLVNLLRPFGYHFPSLWDDFGFAAFILSLAYVAMKGVYASESRLSSIENELAIARQLQFSILPTTTPEIRSLRVAAVYEPMTAVAGDFYEFLPVDDYRAGFLVADVSGHGVPAALIASMIKVAAQSVVAYVDNPSELLHRLGETLSGQLRGQFVSAAYLWIDTEKHIARYSAAGHPPLLAWCAACAQMNRLESNGPLFGTPCEPDFPVREISFTSGDRFLLYTDGLSEPENANGEAFGDHQIERILCKNKLRSASELSLLLLNDVRRWPPTSTQQQDDITFLIIDAL
jgi:sigma-B regulation protein RsbU (phosphoserine phosphatase)